MDEDKKPKDKKHDTDFVIDEKGKPEEAKEPNELKTPKPAKAITVNGESRWKRFVNWYETNKKKSVPLTVLLLIALLVAIPWSRYQVAALFLKQDFNIKLVDSTASTAISGANVSIDGISSVTDGSGKATLRNVPVGHHNILITKKYYKDKVISTLIPILEQKTSPKFELVATGRQVKISVKNLINHTPLGDVNIKVSEISAKTDKTGSATVVLPAGTKSAKASLSISGYNSADVTVEVDNKSIKENNFTLTPAGKIYFLSKLSGKIDIVKTNLDGSGRQTVLAGTGKEDNTGTVLLASRDWKYLAFLSKREGKTNPKLYLINTSDDSMVTIDNESETSFNPIGWSDHNFIYTITRTKVTNWQANHQALKSYDAESRKVTILDQTRGEGSSDYDYASEGYGAVYQIGKTIVYDKYWSVSYASADKLNDKVAGVYSINASGAASQTLKTFGYESTKNTYVNSIPDEASSIYYQVSEKGNQAYYAYSGGKFSSKSDIADEFNKYYQQGAVTYLQSPTGSNTFWGESRDGKNTLFIGDGSGDNGKQIVSLSEFQTYGWYTEDYLLVSKSGSELYIITKAGPSKENPPIKITDYHKPARSFLGYGGGYGGI